MAKSASQDWMEGYMNDDRDSRRACGDEDILACDISDTALEIAAQAMPGAALSFPNAPTVSVLVVCCSQD